MDQNTVHRAVAEGWSASALASLTEFVEIPALSPGFDTSWAETGHLRAAVDHVRDWIAARRLPAPRSLRLVTVNVAGGVPATPTVKLCVACDAGM